MPGPGDHRPDPTEGITRVEGLPTPKVLRRSRNYRRRPCPRCGHSAYRDRQVTRSLHDLGDRDSGRPCDIRLSYSPHFCSKCRKYFNADMTDLAAPAATIPVASSRRPSAWSSRTACPIRPPAGASGGIIVCSSLTPRSRTGSRPGGKKAARQAATEHLDWALSDFSGFIAADELHDGPSCILSIVDNRTSKRLAYQVLDRAPTARDVEPFFRRFHGALEARGLSVRGITTDGSALYPEPIAAVFGDIPHQVCTFHVLREVVKAALSAVAKVRKDLAARKPKLPRGRPTKAARRAARQKKRIEEKIGALFEHRHLVVKRALSRAERRALLRITRGLPQLRTLRELMEEVYRLFDRRCRTETALARLARLRRRVRRFRRLSSALKKLFSGDVEKALTFLDDGLLGATSNAVERGNRRYRKMQKTVYRVRTQAHIVGRIALDMLRESRADGRAKTTKTLHHARAA